MRNADLLVPGTGGITLMDDHGRDLGYPVKMQIGVLSEGYLGGLAAPKLVELLSMEHRPGQLAPVRTSLKAGTSIGPGHVLKVAYNQIPAAAETFLYDWRGDLRYSAELLLDHLERRRPPGGGRWNLVGHSQGGMLIVLASKLLGDRARFAAMVRSVTLVGSPLAGTVNAAAALIMGDQMGRSAAPSFQKIMRTWPALYQMLPAWPVLVEPDGTPAPPDRQITTAAAWEGTPGIEPDLLNRAVETQALLRDPLSMFGEVAVAALMGRNRDTGVTLSARRPLSAAPLTQEPGDTLVPHDRTLATLGPGFAPFVISYPSPCNVHSMLCDDPAIASRIRAIAV